MGGTDENCQFEKDVGIERLRSNEKLELKKERTVGDGWRERAERMERWRNEREKKAEVKTSDS